MSRIWIVFFCYASVVSCSAQEEVIDDIRNDLSTLSAASVEIKAHYIEILDLFSEKSMAHDGYERIYCTLDSSDVESLEKIDVGSVTELLKDGYRISLDAKNYYRIFYEHSVADSRFSITRYGLLFNEEKQELSGIYSLVLPDDAVKELVRIDKASSIIRLTEGM